MQNYAKRFYNSKSEERSIILKEISANIKKYGYDIAADELMRRFKNMKAHYRRKKEDLVTGMIKKIEWEYFELMDDIFKEALLKKNQPAKQRTKAQVKAFDTTETASMPSSIDPSTSSATSTTVNINASTPESDNDCVKNTLKCQNDQEVLDIKEEKRVCNENPELIIINDKKIDMPSLPSPVEMSLKRTKVIQFNNIADITSQLPITSMARATEDSKQAAIKRIAMELKILDVQRLQLDEQRLHLEIKRNEIDKAAYMLTEILSEITKY